MVNAPNAATPRGVRLLCVVAFLASFAAVAFDLGFDSYGVVEFNYFEATRRHIEWFRSIGEPGSLNAETLREHFDHDPFLSPHPSFSRLLSAASWWVFSRGLGIDPVIQYAIIFDTEDQQQDFFRLVRHLKTTYLEHETLGARLSAFIQDQLADVAV